MPPSVPPPLAPYIQSSLSSPHGRILITSVLSTPSPWLLLRLIYAALHGVAEDTEGERSLASRAGVEGSGRSVVFVSLLRPLSLWIEMGKKLGLDFTLLLRSRRIVYIDGLSYGSSPSPQADTSTLPVTRLKSLDLEALRITVDAALNVHASSTLRQDRTVFPDSRILPNSSATVSSIGELAKASIVIDGVDFLLASQPSLSPVTLQSFISNLQARSHVLVLTCNADQPLVQTATSSSNSDENGGTPLERNHSHLLTSMAHQSRWAFQLRSLDTGSAKDVSGVLRVSRGGGYEGDFDEGAGLGLGKASEPVDGKWLYHLKGDGSVKVWGRGE